MRNIQDYIEDMQACELPVRLIVDMCPEGLYFRARIVDREDPGEVLTDRRGERFMEVSGLNLEDVLDELDGLAAAGAREEAG